ncbi:hypothetical protein EVAR_24556_1 [Eumeta japonica]|uniref:Uncharacterized protein n=1 Tax=Eumeta variegata TaxID=151549 RepID=A0A4C1URN8_EUMVA|nr:hypothetical protein EVAR_24556_1 [Eumeta japonica]
MRSTRVGFKTVDNGERKPTLLILLLRPIQYLTAYKRPWTSYGKRVLYGLCPRPGLTGVRDSTSMGTSHAVEDSRGSPPMFELRHGVSLHR